MSYDDAASWIKHFQCLRTLAEALRIIGISLYEHQWHSLVMGSWSLTVGTRHESFLFAWDDREGFISVQGPFRAGH